jgi:non-specific serine/threonine protein kinase
MSNAQYNANANPLGPTVTQAGAVAGGHLPAVVASLIGRERELTDLLTMLERDDDRLMVLTGPGGVGKTRLAIQVAHEMVARLNGRVFYVPLAMLTEPAQVLTAIAERLGINDPGGPLAYDATVGTLREGPSLLVLDNFEQVLDAAPAVATLLIACPLLKMMITSRALPGISGETVYHVRPLVVPFTPQAPEWRRVETVDISDSPAVRLFVARAQAARIDFRLTTANATSVATICQRLDGLPLAIELAAARVKVLPPNALAQRLEQRLPLLSGGAKDMPERLQTMRNALQWSYDLLSAEERRVFRRLSVFQNGWTLTTAAAILTETPSLGYLDIDAVPFSLIETISSLADKSLIRSTDDTSGRRFFMLATIREFGLERLSAEERPALEAAHATWAVAFAEEAEPYLIGPDQADWLQYIATERANLRRAHAWLLANGRAAGALRLAKAIWRFGYTRGDIQACIDWLDQALAAAPEPSSTRGHALVGAGVLLSVQNKPEAARRRFNEALAMAPNTRDRRVEATALIGLGDVAIALGQLQEALDFYQPALELCREVGDPRGAAATITNLGNLYWAMGELDQAADAHQEALRQYQQIGETRGAAWSYTNLGWLAIARGQLAEAAINLEAAQERYFALVDKQGIAETLEAYAELATLHGAPRRAATLYGAAATIREQIGAPVPAIDEARVRDARDRAVAMAGETWAENYQRGLELAIETACSLAIAPMAPEMKAAPASAPAATMDVGLSEPLTSRQQEILEHLAKGETDREIAGALYISIRTVHVHVANLLAKLGVHSRTAAIAAAIQLGLLPAGEDQP